MNDVDLLYVQRLLPMVHNPFFILGGATSPDEHSFVQRMDSFESWPDFVTDYNRDEDDVYNFGRVIYFIDQIKAGIVIDPIALDCVCNNGRVYPEPLIIDGWHRFAAHVIAKAPTIRASFSGRVDLLDYLIGKRKTCPQE